mmetsp:Transcript_13517/g.26950  ORF Transcript_13517/g.26950 Transcript_13517/m.26950 type:complete len:186 (-) Transcript_13517:200-757(-)|eukprot:CAMPEP_0194305464 /NCGR_PEP_ID=MMETSP0171-20130528/2899_1 /TAXON_ID=218684 /ORGANISM="Corethron pennatum, Strain L29A3" /LENGTH=185 /DNA_ID=CAMNT_0039057005 /DNA_START=119 /DNA_END=676 /DNA_ORIENTATION=+
MSDTEDAHIDAYRVGSVTEVEPCGSCKSSGKGLRVVSVDVGGDSPCVNIVTSAQNVRVGSRVVVAPVGSKVPNKDGDGFMLITRATVGGVVSMGMLCDSTMLNWSGGARGVAVQVPDSIPLGSPPPKTKPRLDGGGKDNTDAEIGSSQGGLFEKKLSKEEKKKLAAQKREAKRKAKAEAAGKDPS